MYYTSATCQATNILSSGECTGDSRQGTCSHGVYSLEGKADRQAFSTLIKSPQGKCHIAMIPGQSSTLNRVL